MHRARRRPNRHRPLLRLVVLVAAALPVALAGCGAAAPRALSTAPAGAFLADGRGAVPAGLGDAARLVGRFARVYARSAYAHRAPRFPGEARSVRRALAAAAARAPEARRRLRPHLLGLRLALSSDGGAVEATARIGDGRFPPFTIGFTVAPTDGRWTVTSISLPG